MQVSGKKPGGGSERISTPQVGFSLFLDPRLTLETTRTFPDDRAVFFVHDVIVGEMKLLEKAKEELQSCHSVSLFVLIS